MPPGVRMGEPGRGGALVPDDEVPAFAAWLHEQYGRVEHALRAYHLGPAAWRRPPTSFEELAAMASQGRHADETNWAGFRQQRDVLRFMADRMCAGIREVAARSQAWDPGEPIRTGIHRALENQAANGWDFELQADAIAAAGSFYASFHPTHHLRETDGEMERPCYMTARIVADMNKGRWSAMWESVGGPQTYSGHFSYAFDCRAMERCMLSYLAAGLKGIGIWSWNARDKGWEIGEYSLCDLTGRPSGRAVTAGAIARACQRHRFELWEAHDQPQVGVLYSWENEAAFARMSYGGYPLPRLADIVQLPAHARIGAMRALINGCVPWELVTEREIEAGLAARYRTIYVPHTICLSAATMQRLREYVEAGGRLVVDSPSLLVSADDGTLFDTRQGTDFERVFGLELAASQSTFNYPLALMNQPLRGFWSDVNVTTATVAARFSDGRPAVLAHRLGSGSACFIAFEASSLMHRPGNEVMERYVRDLLLDGEAPPYTVDRPVLAYRRVAPTADHIFLINDRPERQEVSLAVRDRAYGAGEDCVTGEKLAVAGSTLPVVLEPWQGRWIRLEHSV
jgi:beta-galactosidase